MFLPTTMTEPHCSSCDNTTLASSLEKSLLLIRWIITGGIPRLPTSTVFPLKPFCISKAPFWNGAPFGYNKYLSLNPIISSLPSYIEWKVMDIIYKISISMFTGLSMQSW